MFQSRIVHLDLKGAPPRVEYLTNAFIPLLRRLGVTDLLVEWEDMFPYVGELADARCGYAYGPQDVAEILETAALEGIGVIPLVQTFGHLEWLLKHEKFAGLREVGLQPQVVFVGEHQSYLITTLSA